MQIQFQELLQTQPNPEKRFGHSICLVAKNRAILFGGAVGDGQYRITNDLYCFDCTNKNWQIIKPKSVEDGPSPRAAHGATQVETNQMVVFGGAHSHGNLVDNELYLLRIGSIETNAKWTKVPVEGEKPSKRYGHTMAFFKPFILVIGGNIGNNPTSEVWGLSIDKAEKGIFSWFKLTFELEPCARVYHSTAIWKSAQKFDMVLLFGGRNKQNQALNDLWGLRKHKVGTWEWVKAPMKADKYIPCERFQHSMQCQYNLVFLIGGRNNSNNEKQLLPIDVYNLHTAEWFSFEGLSRLRHVSWITEKHIFVHGGFENSKPNQPISSLSQIDLEASLQQNQGLYQNYEEERINQQKTNTQMLIEDPSNELLLMTEKKNIFQQPTHSISDKVTVFIQNGDKEKVLPQKIERSDLREENAKLIEPQEPKSQPTLIENLKNTVLKHLLKPEFEWDQQDNTQFKIKPEIIIALCEGVKEQLKQSPSLIRLRPGVKIFGSLHGQFGDLLRFFKAYGVPDDDPSFKLKADMEGLDYLFMGNYVDRGKNSLEVICTLFALKLKFPKQLHLLRGAHEDREINIDQGLGTECEQRLHEDIRNPNSVFNKLNETFEYLSYGCVIGDQGFQVDEQILCIPSGIGTNLKSLDQIEKISKPFQINKNDKSLVQRLVWELLWSNPVLDDKLGEDTTNDLKESQQSEMQTRFGTNRIQKFLQENHLQMIIRSHECVEYGAEEFGNASLYTLFSCSDYGGQYKNDAAIFYYNQNKHTLETKSIPYIPGFTKWYQINKNLKNEMFKKQVSMKEGEGFDPKERAVTPPRRITNQNKQ